MSIKSVIEEKQRDIEHLQKEVERLKSLKIKEPEAGEVWEYNVQNINNPRWVPILILGEGCFHNYAVLDVNGIHKWIKLDDMRGPSQTNYHQFCRDHLHFPEVSQ